MDVLPAIPDDNTQDLSEKVGENLTSDAILITDKELRTWQRSNPVGFAAWFKNQMKAQFELGRKQLADTLREDVEEEEGPMTDQQFVTWAIGQLVANREYAFRRKMDGARNAQVDTELLRPSVGIAPP